jgi:hypothetical protein
VRVRKKPVEVQAWSAASLLAVPIRDMPHPVRIAVRNGTLEFTDDEIVVWTLEGKMTCSGDAYLMCGVEGEFYPCDAAIFDKTYEVIE